MALDAMEAINDGGGSTYAARFHGDDKYPYFAVWTGDEPSAVVIHPDDTTAFVANRAAATVVKLKPSRATTRRSTKMTRSTNPMSSMVRTMSTTLRISKSEAATDNEISSQLSLYRRQ